MFVSFPPCFVLFRFSDIRLDDDRGIPTQDFLDSCYAIVPVLGRPLVSLSSMLLLPPAMCPQPVISSLCMLMKPNQSLIIFLPAFYLPLVHVYYSWGRGYICFACYICVFASYLCSSICLHVLLIMVSCFGTGWGVGFYACVFMFIFCIYCVY